MTGRRLPNGAPLEALDAGDYAKGEDGEWYARPPQGAVRVIVPLVHDDETISAVTGAWAITHGRWRLR